MPPWQAIKLEHQLHLFSIFSLALNNFLTKYDLDNGIDRTNYPLACLRFLPLPFSFFHFLSFSYNRVNRVSHCCQQIQCIVFATLYTQYVTCRSNVPPTLL